MAPKAGSSSGRPPAAAGPMSEKSPACKAVAKPDTSQTPKAAKTALEAFQSILIGIGKFAAATDFSIVTDHFAEYEKIQNEVKIKEGALAQNHETIARLSDEQTDLKKDLKKEKESIARLQQEKRKLEKEISGLKEEAQRDKQKVEAAAAKAKELDTKLKSKEKEAKEVKSQFEKEKQRASQLEGDLQGQKTQHAHLAHRLEAVEKELAKLRGFAGEFSPERSQRVETDFEALWKAVYDVAAEYFYQDLPNSNFEDTEIWSRLKWQMGFAHTVPLPKSNSLPAKHMRAAVLLASLSRSIDKHIFQPTYFSADDDEDNSGIRNVLFRQAAKNHERESFTRAILHSIAPEEEEKRSRQRVSRVISYILQHVDGFIPKERTEGFRSEVEKLVTRASNIWMSMRSCEERYEPRFDWLSGDEDDWQTLDIENDNGGDTADSHDAYRWVHEDFLVVFPRLYIISQNPYPEAVFLGTAARGPLWSRARQEVNTAPASSTRSKPGPSRARPGQSRKMSISLNNNKQGAEAENFLASGEN